MKPHLYSSHYTTEHFDCPRLGGTALIIHRHSTEGSDEVDSATKTTSECICRYTCGIANIWGPIVLFRWSKCYHPALRRKAT